MNAQELPLINQFYPEDYKAESQNWSISQADDGFIYVANNSGLLEFNGAAWKLYPTPNETIMRSVKTFNDKVFTGFYMDFGFWTKDGFGSLNYTSLVKEKKVSLLEDEQFWNIIELDGWVLFQSLQRIYIYNLETGLIKKINSGPQAVITKMFKVGGSVYFQETGKGIFKIEKGIPLLVSNADVFKHTVIVLAFEKNNQLVFLTSDKGFFLVDKPYSLGNDELSKYLSDKTIYTAKELGNGSFIIGTISNGAVYVTKDGVIDFKLNQRKGLINNTVLTTFEDFNNDIWLGLDNGINKIDISSSVKTYKDIDGALGTVYASCLFNGNLYLGTNQGLFYKKYSSKDNFKFIKNTQGQVWSLKTIDGVLFCGHNAGTFIVEGGVVNKISNIQGAWEIKKLSSNRLLQGNYDGLYVLEKKNKKWNVKNKVKGFNRSTRYFELYHNNTVFVNHEYKGVYRLKVDSDFENVIASEIDTTVPKGIHSGLLKFQNNIIYSYKDGVYRYHDKSKCFIKDTLLNKLLDKKHFLSGRLIYEKESNRLFSFSKQNINYLRPDKFSSNSIIVKKGISNDLIKGTVGFENIKRLKNDSYLIGTLNGYTVLDLSVKNEREYKLEINSIKNHAVNGKQIFLNLNEYVELSPRSNNLQFSYSVPYFSKDINVKYQYQLGGYMNNWSDWTDEHQILFDNISSGDYVFKVRAKIGGNIIGHVPTYSFSINRVWYFSNAAILIYLVLLIMFSFFMDRIYKRYYRRQREALLDKKEKEFQLKTLANEKELIEMRNKQLNQDVESKNRELAVSTMSMIKKNELLNSIKKEIVNKTDQRSIQNVIKIIDKNLNNTDDWEMFETAFNNADKDFINKIKNLHDTLTPNDLRLCAYLRLNLSSKEIAPLLNISSRSVEVKRYRLRKKMNLPHDVNLTSYILEI